MLQRLQAAPALLAKVFIVFKILTGISCKKEFIQLLIVIVASKSAACKAKSSKIETCDVIDNRRQSLTSQAHPYSFSGCGSSSNDVTDQLRADWYVNQLLGQ